MSNGPPLGLMRSFVSLPYRSTGRTWFSVSTSTPATQMYPGCIRVRWFTRIRTCPLQVNGPDAAPCPIQVLQDQAPVATLGSGFAAQHHRWSPEEASVQRLFDPARPHELQKTFFVARPSYAPFSVGVEHPAGRGEPGYVKILGIAQL